MERSDGLAPVTYLPGVTPPSDRSAHPSSGTRPPVARPTFAAMYDDTGYDDSDDDSGFDAPVDDACARLEGEARAREAHARDARARGAEPADAEPADAEPAVPDRDAELARAENVSMHALTRRGQSRRELERTLRSRDLSDEIIVHEVDRLERVGLIDDIALAQNLVGILQERKGLGRSAIAGELARRLLSPAAIEYALELIDTGDELARARELAVKRAGQLTSYDHETAHRRLSAYLARRGYSGSTVRAAVEHALAGHRAAGGRASGVRFR